MFFFGGGRLISVGFGLVGWLISQLHVYMTAAQRSRWRRYKPLRTFLWMSAQVDSSSPAGRSSGLSASRHDSTSRSAPHLRGGAAPAAAVVSAASAVRARAARTWSAGRWEAEDSGGSVGAVGWLVGWLIGGRSTGQLR